MKHTYDSSYYEDIIARTETLPDEHKAKLKSWFEFVKCPLPNSTSVVLDAGCGPGPVTKFLLNRTTDVTGVDAFEFPLVQASLLVPQAKFVLADLNRALPFQDNTFDLVVAYEVIEHLINYQTFVSESLRILKHGGRLLLKTPNGWDIWRILTKLRKKWYWYADLDKTHVKYFNQWSMWNLLNDAGYTGIRVRCGTRPMFLRNYLINPRLPIVGHGLVACAYKP